jgi:hypothetical protein
VLLKLAGRLQLLHSHIEAKAQRAAATESALAGPLLVYQDVHAGDDDEAAAADLDIDGADDLDEDDDEEEDDEGEEDDEDEDEDSDGEDE